MASDKQKSAAQLAFGEIAPHFADLTDSVLFGEIWENETLSNRDRSLITISALVAMNRVEQLPFHLKRGMDNELSIKEISAAITHIAFYSGWPCAASALERLKEAV